MATVSAFGFGGTDHLNTFFDNYVGEYFGRRAADYSTKQQKDMMVWETFDFGPYAYGQNLQNQLQWYNREAELTRRRTSDSIHSQIAAEADAKAKAYRTLGINPLLIADYGASGSGGATMPVLQAPSSARGYDARPVSVGAGSHSYAGNPLMLASAKEQLRMQKADADTAEADARTANAQSALDVLQISAKIAALESGSRMSDSARPDADGVEVLTHEGWKQLRDNIAAELRLQGYMASEARQKALDIIKGVSDVTESISAGANAAKVIDSIRRPERYHQRSTFNRKP